MTRTEQEKTSKDLILVVDDQSANLKVIANILQQEYNLAFASTGVHALEMIGKKPPVLILLDIMMPEMDGFDVCRKIMENPKTKEIPVIFLSAKSEIEDIVKGFQLGGVDYITKPFKSLEVKVRIKNHLKIQHALRDKIEAEKQKQLLQNEIDVARNTLLFKQKFIASLSHEMRTPLTGIIGMLEIMQKTNLDKNQQEYFNIIKLSADNMAVIIDQILDFSRIQSGSVKLKDQPTYFKELADESQRFFAYICNSTVNFRTTIDEQLPERLSFDKRLILQVLRNLITNAVSHTNEGEIHQHISMVKPTRTHKNDLLIRISIADTGALMEEEKRKAILTPFSQVEKIDSKEYSDMGLGLALCNEFIKILGGQMDVESELNRGTKVSFTFKATVLNNNEADEKTPETFMHRPSTALKILVAEDKIVTQKVLKLMLTSMGHEVCIANNGQEAVELFQPGRFNLILMDIQMPVMNGITATQKLKENYQNLPPIVGLSANAFEGDREKYLAQGMDDYLTKPVKKEDFEALIKKLILQHK